MVKSVQWTKYEFLNILRSVIRTLFNFILWPLREEQRVANGGNVQLGGEFETGFRNTLEIV